MTTTQKAPASVAPLVGGSEIHTDAGLITNIPIPTDRYVKAVDAEASFVGAVLHLPAAKALDALNLVKTEDFADLRLSVVADACRDVAARGVPPDPAVVLAHVRREAIVTGADAVKSLSLLLAELYGTVPTPTSVGYYAAGLLAESLRRRAGQLAARIGQAAEHDTLESLMALVGQEVTELCSVRARQEALGG